MNEDIRELATAIADAKLAGVGILQRRVTIITVTHNVETDTKAGELEAELARLGFRSFGPDYKDSANTSFTREWKR